MRPVRPCSNLTAASSARLAGGEPSYPTTMCRVPPDGAAVVTVVSLDPPAAAFNGVPAHHPQKEAVHGYQTWWATSATSSSLRCWVSSLMRFPPIDTGEKPHWVDSASRSRPT